MNRINFPYNDNKKAWQKWTFKKWRDLIIDLKNSQAKIGRNYTSEVSQNFLPQGQLPIQKRQLRKRFWARDVGAWVGVLSLWKRGEDGGFSCLTLSTTQGFCPENIFQILECYWEAKYLSVWWSRTNGIWSLMCTKDRASVQQSWSRLGFWREVSERVVQTMLWLVV